MLAQTLTPPATPLVHGHPATAFTGGDTVGVVIMFVVLTTLALGLLWLGRKAKT